MATALQINNYGVTTPIRQQQVKRPQPQTRLLCGSCGRCQDNHCDCFERHVDTDYNKCVNHTYYYPEKDLKYVSPPESFFQNIQEEEERRIKELQQQGKNVGFI